jgi:PAS domain S-box-containing protein
MASQKSRNLPAPKKRRPATGRSTTASREASLRRMATIVQNSNDAILMLDLDGNILAWNLGAEKMYGWTEAEALKMNINETVPSEQRAETAGFLQQLKRGQIVESLETKRRTRDGRILDIWLSTTKIVDDKAKLTGVATTERDITERKRSEQASRRMATIVQNSSDAILMLDLDGNILAWNRGAEKMYGWSEVEALRLNINETVPAEQRAETAGFLEQLKLGQMVESLETKRRTRDGRILDIWLATTKIVDDQGKLTGVATTERDITERKRSEQAIREKTAEMEFLLEGQVALTKCMRGEQELGALGKNILNHMAGFLNVQMAAFFHVPEGQGRLHRLAGYAYANTDDKARAVEPGEGLVGQAASDKRTISIDRVPANYFRIRSDLGEAAPSSLLVLPVLYENDVNAVIELASFEPFTDKQKAFLNQASEAIGIAVNTSETRRKIQELLEKTQADGKELQVQQEELRAVNEELEGQSEALRETQTRLKAQQSELEEINEQLEEQTQAVGLQRDLLSEKNSALTTAQSLLEERAAEVQRASQYKSEFLANMSHELRTPLNSSLILAKVLADNAGGNLTPEQVQYSLAIYSAGNDLLSLINDILDLSKVEAGKLEIRPESVRLPKVLQDLERLFKPLADEKGLVFQVAMDPDVPREVLTDRQRLEQVLRNLLSNAFKFTDKGHITLGVSRRADGSMAFSVEDSGIGIPADQQEVIFEAFKQADGSTNRKYGGTGLGLSISRDLARLLGGSIQVESTPDEGSCFTLVLPATYVESGGTAEPPRKSRAPARAVEAPVVPAARNSRPVPFLDDRDAPPASARRTILVIEDDPLFARILFDLAHELRYRCLTAQDAQEGLALAQSMVPDGILLDMGLPDHSGLSVLDQLKEDPRTRHIPVHVVALHDHEEKALEMGAIGYLHKPAGIEGLREVFSRIESKLCQRIKRVLVVEDDDVQRDAIATLIGGADVSITAVALASQALEALKGAVFDCMIMDLKLPDMPGEELLEQMSRQELGSFPPVIVYTGRSLSRQEEEVLRKHSRSIIVKGARSPERLLDEVTLFLHRIESPGGPHHPPLPRHRMGQEQVFEGRRILVVDDDVRNVFALSAALEQHGAAVEVARNGRQALSMLDQDTGIDLVLMDVMMPEMDGYQATREIRKQKRFTRLPIIAVTAKATREDQALCMAAGASDYLAKPLDLHQLFSLLRVWIPKLGRQ